MNNKASFRIATMIMIIALVIMAVNNMIFPMNDWTVRIIGVVMMIDLVFLVYSFMRNKSRNT